MDLDPQSHQHAAPWSGEAAALAKASLQAPAMWEQILLELREAGPAGLTPDEFAEAHLKLINTVRRRFTDLWKSGQIRHHPEGLHRPNADRNPCVVWVLGEDVAREKRRSGADPAPAPASLSDRELLDLAPPGMLPLEALDFGRAIEAALARKGAP